MTNHQKLLLRQSELKASLSDLLDQDVEKRAETYETEIKRVSAELRSLETEIQAALLLDSPTPTHTEPTGEGRELRSLMGKANVGAMFDSVLAHGVPTGPMAELQQHYGLDANQLPVHLITRDLARDYETRAVTPGAANTGENQQAIVPYVFPESVASFLGVDMPTVGVGEAVFPVLTSELSVGTPSENAAQNETTGAFSSDVLSPSRLQASFFYSREDRARFAGMDAALRENLSMGLSDGLDAQIIAGTNGLLNGTNLGNHNVTAATTFDLYMAGLAYGRVDGQYAASADAIRLVMGRTPTDTRAASTGMTALTGRPWTA